MACRTGVPEWIGLTEDPRVRARPGSARVAVERYRDRWGFNGAVFATQSDSPTFVPGPTFDAWLSLNRLFPLGFPSEMTIHDDGSVWSKLSTDYPLTEGWLVAQRPDVPAYFLSSWIEAAVPFEVRGYPLGNLGGPIVPGATIQDFEGGRFALVGVDAEARPTVSFSPWPAEVAPSIEPRSLVKDPTGATQWWVDESGGRWWVPTGDVRDCLLTGPNALVEEPVTAVELAPLAVRGAVEMLGLSLEDAVRMASINPARFMGLDGQRGSLTVGKAADFVLLDDGLAVTATYIAGAAVYQI